MKKLLLAILILALFPFSSLLATIDKPTHAVFVRNGATAVTAWENPEDSLFSKVVLFRSEIPIADYFTYEAVDAFCDKIYEGTGETYTDTGLAVNLPYYYIIFAFDQMNDNSKAVLFTETDNIVKPAPTENNPAETAPTSDTNATPTNINSSATRQNANNLANVSSARVNEVSKNEAGLIYRYNGDIDAEMNEDSRRLSLFIIVKSPHDLKEQDKRAISYFIHEGTPTTILLGSGERTGVLNSYLSVFDKLPTNELEWQDVIKIANGRWPTERSIDSEETAETSFQTIYKRSPNMDNPKDNAAVTVIAYGLRPANRNMASEKNAINIYRSIFDRSPVDAADWDLVRAIAYSGATR